MARFLPVHAGVGDQREAERLAGLAAEAAAANAAMMGEEQVAAQL